MFASPEFHNLARGVTGASSTITAPRLAFIVFKLMQFLGRDTSGPSQAAAGTEDEAAAADNPDVNAEQALYQEALQLCIRAPGRHFATHHNYDGTESTSKTLLNIVVPPEVQVLSWPFM